MTACTTSGDGSPAAAAVRCGGPPLSLVELSDHDARAALASVAPAERHCLELVYFDGLSVAEIAALSRLPAACVSDRLRRGSSGVHRHLANVAATDAPRALAAQAP